MNALKTLMVVARCAQTRLEATHVHATLVIVCQAMACSVLVGHSSYVIVRHLNFEGLKWYELHQCI